MRSVGLFVLPLSIGCGSAATGGAPSDAGSADEASPGPSFAAIDPPRPIAPVSVSYSTSRSPTFRWELAPGSDGARVEACADRACTTVTASFDAAGDHARPPYDLPAGVVFWRLRGRSGDLVGAATSPTWQLVAPASSAPIATTWGAAIDANGDGFAEVVVGDSDRTAPTGRVFVHAGGPRGPAAEPAILSAPAPVAQYGAALASAGDVDGDGFGDLLVGSPGEGRVYVYRGGPGGFEDPPSVLQGAAEGAFGAAVSGAGDVDGDGYADVVVGAPTPPDDMTGAGSALVLFGAPGGLSMARSTPLVPRAGANAIHFGQFVSSAGDMDGDGRADVAAWGGIGANNPQEIALYLGGARAFGAAPSVSLRYDGSTLWWLGDANMLVCAGDVNGDGYSDLAVATARPPDLAYVLDHVSVFFGGPLGPDAEPSRRIASPLDVPSHFGLSLAAGDVNGDGLDDLLVGTLAAPMSAPIAGVVFEGSSSGPTMSLKVPTLDTAAKPYEREIGSGDVDGDGYADAFIAHPALETPAGDGGVLHGAVEVHRGGAGGMGSAARWVLLPPDGDAVAYGASLVRP